MTLAIGRRPLSIWLAILAAALVMALSVPSRPAGAAEASLPVPRFVSLHASKVNVRTGPGVRYPVEWVLVRRGIPLEIVAEFENWRKVRDWQGTEGWVHRSMLSGRRTALVTGGVQALRRKPTQQAAVVARAESGVVGRLLECDGAWCRIEVSGFKGWLKRRDLWGVYEDEILP